MGSSDKRRSVTEKLNEEKRKREFDADTIQTLKDIEVRYQNRVFSVTNMTVFKDELVFYKIEIDAKNLKPMLKYSLTITSDLQFQCYHSNIRIRCCHFNDLGVRDSKINLFSQIELVLKKLDNMNDEQPDEDIEFYIENLRKYECKDASVRSKLDFLIEQIQIAFMHVQHRRYSSELLSMCVLWENTSSTLYRQICDEGVLTLPSVRYIKKLNSALFVDTGLTQQTIKYLEARVAKLNELEKIGSLIMDEVYVAKRCEFTRSDGRIYGMEENEPTKTLLTVMVKSVAAAYEDVIAMVPLTKIDSGKINNLFSKVLEAITPLGYNVVATLLDGHSSNAKFYKKELCNNKLKSHITHPLDDSKKIFLSFDSAHIFKCIYNNFEKRKLFSCPSFDGGEAFEAKIEHVKDLHNLEYAKPVKMAHELNDECLHPQSIEKTKE